MYLPFLFLLCYFTCRLAGQLKPRSDAAVVAVVYQVPRCVDGRPTPELEHIRELPGPPAARGVARGVAPELHPSTTGSACGSSCRASSASAKSRSAATAPPTRPAGTASTAAHALYDVALNLVFLGLQYVTPGESVASRHALEEERLSKLPFST